jgi:hypothetical protein
VRFTLDSPIILDAVQLRGRALTISGPTSSSSSASQQLHVLSVRTKFYPEDEYHTLPGSGYDSAAGGGASSRFDSSPPAASLSSSLISGRQRYRVSGLVKYLEIVLAGDVTAKPLEREESLLKKMDFSSTTASGVPLSPDSAAGGAISLHRTTGTNGNRFMLPRLAVPKSDGGLNDTLGSDAGWSSAATVVSSLPRPFTPLRRMEQAARRDSTMPFLRIRFPGLRGGVKCERCGQAHPATMANCPDVRPLTAQPYPIWPWTCANPRCFKLNPWSYIICQSCSQVRIPPTVKAVDQLTDDLQAVKLEAAKVEPSPQIATKVEVVAPKVQSIYPPVNKVQAMDEAQPAPLYLPRGSLIIQEPMNSSGDVYHHLAYVMLCRELAKLPPGIIIHIFEDGALDRAAPPKATESTLKVAHQCFRAEFLIKKLDQGAFFKFHHIVTLASRPNVRKDAAMKFAEVDHAEWRFNFRYVTTCLARCILEHGLVKVQSILRAGFNARTPCDPCEQRIRNKIKPFIDNLKTWHATKKPADRCLVIQMREASTSNQKQNLIDIWEPLRKAIGIKWPQVTKVVCVFASGYTKTKEVNSKCKNALRLVQTDDYFLPFLPDTAAACSHQDIGKLYHISVYMELLQFYKDGSLLGVIGNTSGLLDVVGMIGHHVLNIHHVDSLAQWSHLDARMMLQTTFLTVQLITGDAAALKMELSILGQDFQSANLSTLHAWMEQRIHFPQRVCPIFPMRRDLPLLRNNSTQAVLDMFADFSRRRMDMDKVLQYVDRRTTAQQNAATRDVADPLFTEETMNP